MRISAGLYRVVAYVRGAPGTYVWLGMLFVTTVAVHHMSPEFEHEFLRERSTNISGLSQNPLRVLFASAMLIDGGFWLPYVVLYSLFHAPAERWLGTVRWLVVCLAAHILATLISEGAVLLAIWEGRAPFSSVDALDIGVSYALAGVVGILTYRIAMPWRLGYLAVLLAVYGIPLAVSGTFTDFGHFISVLIGLACHPLTRGRGEPWNPKETLRTFRGGVRP
ncbi:rhomboid-like protein [Streptomyces sp. NPDC048751]|uniref:rhomboid-like protein n=1 Tax=Streptomyces sp. NPDC048751 TaxID=3365591 RepID=UPI00371F3989